jgi:hypothetical protein
MEAAVADREAEMTEWNDGRLDDLNKRVERVERKMDAGFARLDEKIDKGLTRVDARIDSLGAKVDSLGAKVDRGFDRFDARVAHIENQLLTLHVSMSRGSLVIAGSIIAAAIGVIAT